MIVLIDDRTKDRTLEIVKTFPSARYELIKWKGFSGSKKYGVELAQNDWILWIDADETLSEELQQEINEFKNEVPFYNSWSFPRKANFLGRWILHSGWYPARVTRLFNKHKVFFSDNNVHEHLITEGKTGELRNDLEHYTDPDITHYFSKLNEYTSLAAEELYNNHKKFRYSDLVTRPLFILFKMYILKRGFLDGLQGFILALFSSSYVFIKYCKFWERKKRGSYD
jgi:glycosyltransferase involved in cell wall biosynthesis